MKFEPNCIKPEMLYKSASLKIKIHKLHLYHILLKSGSKLNMLILKR